MQIYDPTVTGPERNFVRAGMLAGAMPQFG